MSEKKTELKLFLLSQEGFCCRVVLHNRSDRSLWINRRFVVNHPTSPPHFRELDFLIHNAYGRVAEFVAKVRVGLPQREDFVELPPDGTVERSVDIAVYYALEEGENYEVQAIYENYFVPEELRGASVWTGRLVSRPLKVAFSGETPVLAR